MKVRKIVFFDIDDTLFESSNFRILARKKSLRELGRSLRKFGFDFDAKFLYDEFEMVYQQDKNAGNMYDKLLVRLGVPEYQISRHVAVAVATWENNKRQMKGFEGISDVLSEVEKKGYCLGIASSGIGMKQWDKLYRIGVIDFFDPKYVFITAEVNGMRRSFAKDKLFYKQIISSYKNESFDEFYMVGDKFLQDIMPSHEAGFIPIFVKSAYFKSEDESKAKKMGIAVVDKLEGILNYL